MCGGFHTSVINMEVCSHNVHSLTQGILRTLFVVWDVGWCGVGWMWLVWWGYDVVVWLVCCGRSG